MPGSRSRGNAAPPRAATLCTINKSGPHASLEVVHREAVFGKPPPPPPPERSNDGDSDGTNNANASKNGHENENENENLNRNGNGDGDGDGQSQDQAKVPECPPKKKGFVHLYPSSKWEQLPLVSLKREGNQKQKQTTILVLVK